MLNEVRIILCSPFLCVGLLHYDEHHLELSVFLFELLGMGKMDVTIHLTFFQFHFMSACPCFDLGNDSFQYYRRSIWAFWKCLDFYFLPQFSVNKQCVDLLLIQDLSFRLSLLFFGGLCQMWYQTLSY
jgi:hypothetical protein